MRERTPKKLSYGGLSTVNEFRILPYHEGLRGDVLALTAAAWASVLNREGLDQLPPFAYDAFFPDGWQIRQTSDVAALLTNEPDGIWVATLDGKLVGFVGLRIAPKDRMGEIHILAVSPEARRQGIANRLLRHAESVIKDAGMSMVMIETTGDAGHGSARRTYEAAGYVQWPIVRYLKEI